METNRLFRITNQKTIGGVAAGIAHHFNVDRTLVRILFVLTFFFAAGVPIVFIYILLWAFLPKAVIEEAPVHVIRA
jgi:phage shock protein C